MKRIALFISLLICTNAFAQQTISITDAGPVSLDCGFGPLFEHAFQDDNPAGQYPSSITYTVTVCPDGLAGSKVTLRMFPEVGDVWDVHGSDTLFVYDGDNTSAPLLGAYNSDTDTNGISVQATFDNPSGCLTFQFVSNGADEGDGFQGLITCGYPCQPFSPFVVTNPIQMPADTGWIDICLGDTVWLNGSASYPHSGLQGGIGYDQQNTSSTFDWEFADGTIFEDSANIYFVPQVRAGYFVEMRVTDTLGCIAATSTKIRVSTIPSFAETVILAEDTVCIGESTLLLGGVSSTDTTGVAPTTGAFINGGIFAGLTYLPDGSGVNYETDIEISHFDTLQVVQNVSDIIDVCITIEHSYLGDLEMMLTCPDGTSIILFNSYTGEGIGPEFAGGFGGGGTFLGDPIDNTSGQPGIGWEYCFSDGALWGTMGNEHPGNTIPTIVNSPGQSMAPGTYLPEESFNNLIGCPINGTWTITVRDNIGADDGYIFEWGVLFNPDIDPNAEFYLPSIVDAWWSIDPTIIVNQGDTLIEVLPPTPGDYFYQFNVTDNFGCPYDTTLQVHAVPTLTSFTDDDVCSDEYALSASDYEILGEWSWTGPAGGVATFNPNTDNYQTTATINVYGDYQFIYTSDYCGQSDTVFVDFNPTPAAVVLADQTICPGTDLVFDAGNEDIGASYAWSPGGATSQVVSLDSILASGGIQVTVTNDCGTSNGAATIDVHSLTVTGPLEVCLADQADLTATFTTPSGNWAYTGPTGATASFTPDMANGTPTVSVDMEGSYQFVFTDDQCAMVQAWDVFFAPAPTVEITTDTTRICVEGDMVLVYNTNTDFFDNLEWSPFGLTQDTLIIAGDDPTALNIGDSLYHVTASISNFCGTDQDEIIYEVIDCNLDVPNVFNPESSLPENQYFNIVALDLHAGNNVKIFDRWGRKCYDVDDYHLNPWRGDKEADGVYYWVLVRSGYEAETGYVHLLHGSSQ
ncbi:MAG: subtilisin-like proprotein convertase family protein [Bacteroidia bacterium]|jgi:subtilisin-like proprotein convertase family protein